MATLTFIARFGGLSCNTSGYCSGAGTGSTSGSPAETSGTPEGFQFALSSSASGLVGSMVTCRPAVGNWASGNYTVTINVTGTNMNLTLTEIWLCRVNESCVNQSTVGSLTGIGRSLASTGSVDHTVSGAAQGTASSTDRLLVVLIGNNGQMSSQSATIEVTIATPIDAGGVVVIDPMGQRGFFGL